MTANSNKVGAHGENGASFEESFTLLQEVVGKLSTGNLSLQEALSAFEQGMGLADTCARKLDEAELRVKQVSDKAIHAGSASLVGLDEEMRGSPAMIGLDNGKLVLEIETYEATFAQVSGPQDVESNGDRAKASNQRDMGKGNSQPVQSQELEPDLDPLFDDED
ncbi:MAG: exodeoxyribonuclease VII small subunit [Chloroflexota bacterium]